MTFRGDRLREYRQIKGYTQEEFAELTNIALRQVPRYEAGEVNPSADVVSRMAETLGITSDYLLGLADDPDAHLTEEDLTPLERKLLQAFRRGELRRALLILAGQETIQTGEAADITSIKPTHEP